MAPTQFKTSNHISDGSISPEDLAWIGGEQEDWKPLKELIAIEVLEEVGSPTAQDVERSPAQTSERTKGGLVGRLVYKGVMGLAVVFVCLTAILFVVEKTSPKIPSSSEGTQTVAKDRQEGADSREKVSSAKVISESEPEKPMRTSLFGKSATDASVLEIIEAYDSNPLAGDQQFKGQRLRVTGIVRQVRETPAGDGYFASIQPVKGLPLNSRKVVSIRTKDEKVLATFEAGSVVTVVGEMTGLDLMDYPRIDSAVVERQASALSPIPGAVFDWTKEERPELDFKDAKVQQAAKLYLTSLNNQIANGIMPDYGSMDQARLAEVVLLEEGPRHSFFRIAMTGMRGSRPLLNYAFVVVEQKPDGSFPEVNSESYLINTVVQCGPKPTGEHMFTVKRANGWTLKDGWPD